MAFESGNKGEGVDMFEVKDLTKPDIAEVKSHLDANFESESSNIEITTLDEFIDEMDKRERIFISPAVGVTYELVSTLLQEHYQDIIYRIRLALLEEIERLHSGTNQLSFLREINTIQVVVNEGGLDDLDVIGWANDEKENEDDKSKVKSNLSS